MEEYWGGVGAGGKEVKTNEKSRMNSTGLPLGTTGGSKGKTQREKMSCEGECARGARKKHKGEN